MSVFAYPITGTRMEFNTTRDRLVVTHPAGTTSHPVPDHGTGRHLYVFLNSQDRTKGYYFVHEQYSGFESRGLPGSLGTDSSGPDFHIAGGTAIGLGDIRDCRNNNDSIQHYLWKDPVNPKYQRGAAFQLNQTGTLYWFFPSDYVVPGGGFDPDGPNPVEKTCP